MVRDWGDGEGTVAAEEEIIEKIKKLEAKNDEVIKEMKKVGVKALRNDEWQIEDECKLRVPTQSP